MNRRERFRAGLAGIYLPYYDALCAELGPEWGPYSGFRTFPEQAVLYLQGRETPGKIVTDAHAGESPHNYGCASDWCLWDSEGTPHWPDRKSKDWDPYLQACTKVGLSSGSAWNDFPHNEALIKCRWTDILVAYDEGGMAGARAKIQAELA